MKNTIFLIILTLLIQGCSRNIVTGRKQLRLVNESQLQLMAADQYRAFLDEHEVLNSSTSSEAALVQRVGNRIAQAVSQYYADQGTPEVLEGYEWEFSTIASEQANAWVMPGGKVAVYTGLLKITETEDALAIVMGHEIAHAVAQHGSERMSQAMVQQLGGIALDVALSQQPQQTRDLFLLSYGIGTHVGAILPWSRQQELEADRFGLRFAAMAGYDPRAAVPFWQRMSEAGGPSPPEFLSTHPADSRRIRELEKLMPEAMEFYRPRN
jgi:predicted Zn-dependent protease